VQGLAAAASPALTIPDPQVARLITAIRTACQRARALIDAKTEEARLAEVKPLVQSIVEAVDIVLAVAKSPYPLPTGLPELIESLARGDLTAIVTAAVTVFKTLPGAEHMSSKVLRVLSFAAEITKAKTSDEAAAAIDAVIAPIGSYRLKRARRMVSLGGLLGLGGGVELLSNGRLRAGDDARASYLAPVAPVGVDVSLPLGNRFVPDAGVFVSVIDLGSLMSYRSSSDPITVMGSDGNEMQASVSNTSVVGFTQVLSPGVFLRARVGGSPIVAMFGAAFVPHARQVSDASGAVDFETSAVRLSVALSVDIPFVPFHW
jgi:hypothetical protein